jgi:glycerol-3-phosphate O-acyltransferase/dihydroxyacetone phosphate acyltransferase
MSKDSGKPQQKEIKGKPGGLTNLLYDLIVAGFWCVLHIFFKLSVRGRHQIPSKGPILFVAAPHANQFIDPCMLQITAGRRIGFIAAAKSMRRLFVGLMAKCLNSIPVERPQDLAKQGDGRVFLSSSASNDEARTLEGIESECN